MPVLASQIAPLSTDEVPGNVRSWVEAAITLPINRILDLFRALVNRGISIRANVNAQLVERLFIPPNATADYQEQGDWTSSRLDTPITLTGSVLGVQVLGCWTVDSAGHDVAPVSGLASPSWKEVHIGGARVLRLVYVPGLLTATRYRLLLLAWGP